MQWRGYHRRSCKTCENKRAATRKRERLNRRPALKVQLAYREQDQRQDPKYRASLVTKDSRRSDTRAGRVNTLDVVAVRELLRSPCSYCGTTTMKMTLDRVDNSIGHVLSNVVPACIRCNMCRGSMPYEAWLVLVPAVKEAATRGLFGDWTGPMAGAKRKFQRTPLRVLSKTGVHEVVTQTVTSR